MNKAFSGILVFIACLSSCNVEKHEIFLEAESFSERGGWVIDPQFMNQMGSPYLLAHGLGKTVENASTEIDAQVSGNFYIWARTKNWVPGKWEAPGRFRIAVNGKELKNDLGTLEGWNWEYAGKARMNKGVNVIEIHDITGFDGRCDAIYFSTVKTPPPSASEELAAFRKQLLSEPDVPSRVESFDLVITGGGIAGCAASIAAAEQGLNVALIHDRPVLGGNASSEIRVHTEGITGKVGRILNMLNTVHWPNGSPDAVRDDRKRHNAMSSYPSVHQFLNFRAYSVITSADSITAVDARNTATGEMIRFMAPVFIDCTGDGWIGYWAGADYMYGREDSSEYGENWAEHGDLWSPAKADNRVMGSSVLWRSEDAGKPVEFPDLQWTKAVAGDFAAIKGEWQWEYSNDTLNQIGDGEMIRDHMLRAIYGSFSNAKKLPVNANLELEWVSYLLGKRESRRLTGDYVYTFRDAKNMVEFPDAVVVESRAVDVHYQQNLVDTSKPDFLSEANYYKVDHYYIPFRSLYSRNIKNLMMAGRCFSCSHIGLGGPRVMNTTGQMGVATGYAASLCKKYSTNPRGIYKNHIKELQQLIAGN